VLLPYAQVKPSKRGIAVKVILDGINLDLLVVTNYCHDPQSRDRPGCQRAAVLGELSTRICCRHPVHAVCSNF
jgi:hypothetical protein